MSRLIKKLMNVHVFSRRTKEPVDIETGSHSDMDDWKGWDAWVDVKK
ncbi:MAG: hypothetical protein ACTH58_06560 [Marinomonas foliarum]|uniref:Uncharacterized protein n=1 Tax=Marinomonas foliarum TaxID=491950 RepID=A0A369AHA5_9GAMM|nr:hypothetical protein [Marinomonas foliarum]QRV23290.1 hypothetical protein JSY38_14670 [Marinomonas foliarum]RCX08740.1 hypothetical protein DFP77_10158 [Marinomonas foliarum]